MSSDHAVSCGPVPVGCRVPAVACGVIGSWDLGPRWDSIGDSEGWGGDSAEGLGRDGTDYRGGYNEVRKETLILGGALNR